MGPFVRGARQSGGNLNGNLYFKRKWVFFRDSKWGVRLCISPLFYAFFVASRRTERCGSRVVGRSTGRSPVGIRSSTPRAGQIRAGTSASAPEGSTLVPKTMTKP